MLKGVLTMLVSRKRRVLSAPDCARYQALRGVPCHQACSMVFPDIRSPHCPDSLEPSLTTRLFQTSLAAEKQRSTAMRTAQTIPLSLFYRMTPGSPIRHKSQHPRVPSGAQTKNLPAKQCTPYFQKRAGAETACKTARIEH